MPVWLIVLAAFALGAVAVIAIVAGATSLPAYLMRRRLDQRLRETTGVQAADSGAPTTVVKLQRSGTFPGLERALTGTSGGGSLNRLIQQSGSRISVSAVVFLSLLCAVVVGVVVAATVHFVWAPVFAALVALTMPVATLRHRRTARMKQFEEQFPEALDLLSRALRAGHAFTTAMGMVASEAAVPIGPEFRKTYDEQNFGLPLKEALNNLAGRVPLLDVRFFVTAVLIQRDTGGNLSEILDNLAYVVRERFKVLRQVRVFTAHGRFTGYVLLGLPPALAMVLMFINPEHMRVLFTERMGHAMLTFAAILLVVGAVWIRKVIKIEV